MQIISKNFSNKIDYNYYFHNKEICFIDIETTGLSRVYNSIYLVGVLFYNKEKALWTLIQFFAECLEEEKDVLKALIELISNFDEIITYNGDSFDIPFINQRLDKENIPYQISKEKSFDLYRVVKDNRYFLNLDNLKLKTLERHLGLYREDIFTGKDCIQFYLDYVKTKELGLREKVLRHNYDDLYYMLDVLKIMDLLGEKKSLSIDYHDDIVVLKIDQVNIVGDLFVINGTVANNKSINIIQYDNNYKIAFNNDSTFEITIEFSVGLVSPTERGLFIDKNKIALSTEVVDCTIYNLPSNIILLKVEKEYFIENIKAVIKDLITISLEAY